MNVLEKILEEIEKEQNSYEADHAWNYSKGMEYAKEIIRSHMGGATDTDDTEEKIREHIAECLYRIDNIRSFIGSKEYTSNDGKCIRNIEVLKTSMTALEEYLSSKKKNGNNGWIPVEERLPNLNGVYNVTRLIDDAFISDSAYFDGQDTWHNDNRVNHARPYLTDIVAWQPLPEPYRQKEQKSAKNTQLHISGNR